MLVEPRLEDATPPLQTCKINHVLVVNPENRPVVGSGGWVLSSDASRRGGHYHCFFCTRSVFSTRNPA